MPLQRIANTDISLTGSFTFPVISGNTVIQATDNTNAALRITQLGTGNALVVEDSANPDSTPFVIDSSGNVGIGTASPASQLHLFRRADAGAAPNTPEFIIEHQDINAIGTGGSNGGILSFVNIQRDNTAWAADRIWGRINFFCSQPTSGVKQLGASILAASNGSIGGQQSSTYLSFYTSDSSNGGNNVERVRINSSGHVTMPYQPAFYAMMNNVTFSDNRTVVFEDVYVNIGGHYNNTNGRFTAPIAGTYHFSANFLKRGGSGRLLFHKNGTYYGSGVSQAYSSLNEIPQAATIIITLNAGDYVTVFASQDGGDVYGNPNSHNGFSGFLIG